MADCGGCDCSGCGDCGGCNGDCGGCAGDCGKCCDCGNCGDCLKCCDLNCHDLPCCQLHHCLAGGCDKACGAFCERGNCLHTCFCQPLRICDGCTMCHCHRSDCCHALCANNYCYFYGDCCYYRGDACNCTDVCSENWGYRGGDLFDCCETQRCCGDDPCTALACLISWTVLLPCTFPKLYASSMDAKCSVTNHCCGVWLMPCVTIVTLRHNLRRKYGVAGDGTGDCCITYCCCPCACLQHLRAADREDWMVCPPPAMECCCEGQPRMTRPWTAPVATLGAVGAGVAVGGIVMATRQGGGNVGPQQGTEMTSTERRYSQHGPTYSPRDGPPNFGGDAYVNQNEAYRPTNPNPDPTSTPFPPSENPGMVPSAGPVSTAPSPYVAYPGPQQGSYVEAAPAYPPGPYGGGGAGAIAPPPAMQ
eukprot:PhF_6_TR9213/c5_g1_i3/m.14471